EARAESVTQKWRIRIKIVLCQFAVWAGFVRLATWVNRNRTVILCYHGVTARRNRSSDDPSGLCVRRDRFERELGYLKRRYRFLSLGDYGAVRRGRLPLAPNTAIVTFDDGLRNFLTLAAPLLAREAVPATMYLITGRLSTRKDVDRLPTWNPEDDRRF